MKKQNIGNLLIFLSALCFSINGLFIKLFTWNAMSISAVGNLLGAVTIVIFMLLTKHKFIFNWKVLFGATFVFGVNVLTTYANKYTTAANAIVLQFTMPVFIILASWLFLKKRPNKIDVVTTAIVFLGIIFFVVDGLAIGNMFGNTLALLSGVACAGVYMLEEIPGNDSFSAIVLGKLLCFVVGLPWVVVEQPLGGAALTGMLVYGIVQCGLGFVFLPLGLKYASSISASLLSSAEPILAPIWVAIFYRSETISGTAFVGISIVVVVLIVYNVIKVNHQDTREEQVYEN